MYKNTIFNIFNPHVPIKKKYIRANEALFMSKELHKTMMRRSRYRSRNILLKDLTDTNKKIAAPKNLWRKLWKKTKKSYFENLDTKKFTDNRSF